MATLDTRDPEAIGDNAAVASAAEDLGEIVVRRDVLQARARAEAFLLTVRAIRRGIAAMRARRGHN